ncbi:MAG: 1-deoxy-D-xylulose-5-phosphate reductoisomerase [Treponema sp.]|jgi:1-deoxy-D-xylulose-5-phosphate reductoisomerase|nr:1-deoxy-D-xylulose-5-phosphate reductoisomerase [Treponema sp.]
MKKRVAVLGATGSIGKSALDVLRNGRDDFEVVFLSSHTNRRGLLELAGEFPRAALALAGPDSDAAIRYRGQAGLLRGLAECDADLALNGIAGAAGLEPSLAVLEAGADLALANKETMVMASSLALKKAAEKNARIFPVDSEHAAIHALLRSQGRENLEELLLTASGGPFRAFTLKEMAAVTPAQALAHPTWSMGPKITVDSSTMANKGLEALEAAALFSVGVEKVRVVIHPQSVVHSMIRLRDGAVYAQLSKPDMRLPIHQALYGDDCVPCPFGRLDFDALTLSFEKPDTGRFPMLALAYQAGARGGLCPAAYNGANEIAAAAFLANAVPFLAIPDIVAYVLEREWGTGDFDLESVMEADRRARRLAKGYIAHKWEK